MVGPKDGVLSYIQIFSPSHFHVSLTLLPPFQTAQRCIFGSAACDTSFQNLVHQPQPHPTWMQAPPTLQNCQHLVPLPAPASFPQGGLEPHESPRESFDFKVSNKWLLNMLGTFSQAAL